MGNISALEITTGVPSGKRPKCRPVELLLEKAVWEGHFLSIDVRNVNRAVIAVSFPTTQTEWAALASTEFWWPVPQWWEWKNEDDMGTRPQWWYIPEFSLVSTDVNTARSQLMPEIGAPFATSLIRP